jgi:hypothetical protein
LATAPTLCIGWTAACIPNHSDAELAEYARSGELAYMAHKAQQGKEYIRSHPAQYAYRVLRRVIYIWTGYWSFNRAYLADEPLDVPNIFLSTTMTVLALGGWRLSPSDAGGVCTRVWRCDLLWCLSFFHWPIISRIRRHITSGRWIR